MPATRLAISIVAPAHNEEDNVEPLVCEIEGVMTPLGLTFEIIVVDDGSTDATLQRLQSMLPEHPALRVLKLRNTPKGRGHGQAAAFSAGIRASRGELIALLDADLQNDPADVPKMLDLMEKAQADMIQGDRSGVRKDNIIRRLSSVVSRWFRRVLLADSIRDCACSTRLLRRDLALRLPLEFRGQHRFMPITARDMGFTVVEMPACHRPRVAGQAKYGIWNRALPGLIDCFAVRWMRRRRRPFAYDVVEPAALDPAEASNAAAAGAGSALPAEKRRS